MKAPLRLLFSAIVFLWHCPGLWSNEEAANFEQHVRPILKAYCLDCHGGEKKLRGGLDLRLKRTTEQGGKTGPGLVAGRPADSLIVQRLRAGEMPPGEKKLSAAQIAVIEKWIATGARTLRGEPASLPPGIHITAEERAYWFYQPLRRPSPPQLSARVRTPIDAFILARLGEKKLDFAADADRPTLLRRAAFDLTGLPPSQADIDAYLTDASEQAYEKMLDRLLASPHYGERWARHWLDVAGYADSDGDGNTDTVRPFAYKYRDWVIRALNADLPLNQFIVEQLAGDELVTLPWSNLTPDQIDKLTATGFLRTAPDPTSTGGGDLALESNQVVADTIKIVSSSLLGLTVGCAQCHDHRYDPIPQADYYRLRAIFEPALSPAQWRRPGQRLVSLYTDADRAKAAAVEKAAQKLQAAYDAKQQKFMAAALEKELAKYAEPLRTRLRQAHQSGKRTPEQSKLLAAHPSVNISPGILYQYNQAAADELKKDMAVITAKRAERPIEDFLSVCTEVPGVLPATFLFHRGDHRQPKDAVRPGDLTIAAGDGRIFDIADAKGHSSGRRLAWARHLTSGTHPLLGRVLANRIWLHHFGRGLVNSPGDFGILGDRPSHPELLDWLADELVRQGWSLKRMHKLIMTSTVYRQSSRTGTTPPDESLYARFPLRRLDAETLRDHILAVSGRLDPKPFGKSIPVEEDFVGQVTAKGDSPRRSIYLQVRRTRPVSFLAAFDAPGNGINCDRRTHTTAAPQSLMLMNNDFVLKHAGLFAQRLLQEPRATPEGRLALAWSIAYQRKITADELQLAAGFIARQRTLLQNQKTPGNHEHIVLTNLCQQLLSSNEFLYVD
ncbi:MAG: DUF1549 domain-containing protein [Planctomycetes bacterium]|nr:DUF1549 domain-containing protein [Planctomycetota bacterium]